MTNPMTLQKKSLKMIFAFLMIASCPWITLGGSHSRTQRQHLEKNSINLVSKSGSFASVGADSDWLKISVGLPNSVIRKAGESLELECEVLGSPPPNVKWLKDGKIFYPREQQEEIGNDVAQELFGGTAEEEEDNNLPTETQVLRSLYGGMAKVVSRLRIPCLTPKNEGVYTCLTMPSSSQMSNNLDEQDVPFPQAALSSTFVNVQGRRADFRNAACTRGGRLRAEGAWVQEWSPVVMQLTGKDIVISCQVGGQPKPTVSWLNSAGKPISFGNSIDSRQRVLPTGDLYISELRWEDMGGYTCVVRNSIGKSSETTFLYPVRSEEQS